MRTTSNWAPAVKGAGDQQVIERLELPSKK